MKILARIPALPPPALEPPPAPEQSDVRVAPSTSRRRSPARSLRFPTSSVLVLALIAAALWAAATWREQLRFARQHPKARWAEAFEGPAATVEGVVR